MRRLSVLVALAVAVSFGCGSMRSGPALTSPNVEPTLSSPAVGGPLNVHGTLDRGSVQNCPPGDPCDPALVGAFLVFSQPGKQDVRTSVTGTGEFALHLDPGSYTITAAPSPANGRLQPGDVRVPTTGTVALHLAVVRTP